MEKIRIMLADDHPVARAGIRKFLNKATDIDIIAEADNGTEALELAKRLVPDVLLLDIEFVGDLALASDRTQRPADLARVQPERALSGHPGPPNRLRHPRRRHHELQGRAALPGA